MPKTSKGVKRVAIYDRLSKDRTGQAESVENHIAACRQFIEQRGWTVTGEPFIDRDISGYDRRKVRPAFAAVLAGIEAGDFDAVCVWKLDRFGRRMVSAIKTVEQITEAGAELLSVSENVDTSTAMGRGVLALLFSVAETESENISTRVSLAWQAKAIMGLPHVGGRRCFGYTANMAQIPAEVEEARHIVKQVLAGASLNSVAVDLNARGVKTPGTKKRPEGGGWTGASVRQWLAAPALAGIRRHKGTDTPGRWESIITVEEREQLLVRLGTVRPGGGIKPEPRFLLTGLVRCGSCKEKMSGHNGRYLCRPERNPRACGRVTASQARIDEHVTEQLLTFLAAADSQPLPVEQDPKVLAAAIEANEARLERLNRARFVDEAIGQEEWQSARDELVTRLETSRAARVVLEAGSGLRPGTREELDQWWESATIEERRAAMRDAFGSVIIDSATKLGCKFDSSRIRLEWAVLADLTPVTVEGFDVPGVKVYVVPGGRLNR